MNRIFINTKRLVEAIYLENNSRYGLNSIEKKLLLQTSNALAFYSYHNDSIYINGKVIKRHYSNEEELIEILIRILPHEHFHQILAKEGSQKISILLDNTFLANILEDYGIMSKRQVDNLNNYHNTFIY